MTARKKLSEGFFLDELSLFRGTHYQTLLGFLVTHFKEVKAMDTELVDSIVNYIELSLKEKNMSLEEFFSHLSVCPLCHVKVIECPFCHKRTPIDYKCHRCEKVLPLQRLPELIAKTF